MKITRLIALSMALTCLSFAACAQGKPAPKDAVLYCMAAGWHHHQRRVIPSSILRQPTPPPKLFITRRVEHALDVAVQHEHKKTGPPRQLRRKTRLCLS